MKTSTAIAILAAALMLTAGSAQGTETELSPARLAATVTIYISQCGGKLNEKQRAAFTAAVRRPNFDRKKYEDVITQWRNETISKVGKTNVCPALADMMESTIDLLSTLDGEYVVDLDKKKLDDMRSGKLKIEQLWRPNKPHTEE